MTVLKATALNRPKSIPLDVRETISDNLKTADEGFLYNPHYEPAHVSGVSDVLELPRSGFSVLTPSSHVDHPPLFYRGVHFVRDEEVKDGGTLNLGILTSGVPKFFGVFNYSGRPSTVEIVGVEASSAGLIIGNIEVSDVLGPYEERTVSLTPAPVGTAVIDTYFYVKLSADSLIYRVKVQGIRIKTSYLLDMNWVGGTSTTRRFLTSVYKSGTSAETRKAKRHVPIREFSSPITYFNKGTALQARTAANICTSQDHAMPVYPDKAISTAPSGTSRIYCPTEYRRFSVGGLAVIVKKKSDRSTDYYDILTIDSVESDGLVSESPLLNSYDVGDVVYPLTICIPNFDGVEHEVFNDGVGEYRFSSTEQYGNGLALENPDYVPETLRGIPIYPFDINYGENVTSSLAAQGMYEDSGRGQAYYALSSPAVAYSALSLFSSRTQWWEALGFFNYVKGMFRKFWYTEPIDMFDVAGYPTATTMDIDTTVSLFDLDYIKYLQLTDATGAVQIVEVTSKEEIAEGLRFTTEERTISEPVKVRLAKLVRLNSDMVEESWLTASVVTISFEIMELSQADI